MTITTAKLPALKLLALAAMLVAADARADWKVVPKVDLRETYSDNIGLQDGPDARSGFISEAAPGFSISSNGPRLKVNADADWRLFAYSDKNAPNLHDSERRYNANAQAMLVDQLLYVDATANGSRQAISAFGPVSSNTYSSYNNTDVRTWRISPYLRHSFGSRANLTLRYTRDSVTGGAIGYGNSMANSRSLDLSSGTAFTTLGWNLASTRQELSDRVAGKSTSENSTAGLRWNLIRRFSLTGNVGYDKYDYPTLGESTKGRSWSGGFIWTPSSRTNVQASFGRRYFGKTGSLASSYRTQHSVWTLDYSDAITTSRQQFLLPAAVDTAAMLDNLFAATYPDPVQRQQIVQAYIAASGLPPTLLDSINYLSNRYMRNKRLQGAAVFRGARSSLTLTLFHDERNALSTQQSDSNLLLGQLATLNDNTRQRGFNVNMDYRLSPRTNAFATQAISRVRSLDTDVVNNINETRLGLNHRFAARSQGSLELRRSRGRADFAGNSNYHENAIVATLSVQY